MTILIRLCINAAALWAAVRLVPGVSFTGDWRLLLVVALIFGVLNAALKPLLMVLSLPFLIVTLGLFTFVVNAFLLWLTSALSAALGLGFHVTGFGSAFVGALVVSCVSVLLSIFAAPCCQLSYRQRREYPAPHDIDCGSRGLSTGIRFDRSAHRGAATDLQLARSDAVSRAGYRSESRSVHRRLGPRYTQRCAARVVD